METELQNLSQSDVGWQDVRNLSSLEHFNRRSPRTLILKLDGVGIHLILVFRNCLCWIMDQTVPNPNDLENIELDGAGIFLLSFEVGRGRGRGPST